VPTDNDAPDDLAPFRQTLADLLATLRREAGLTQQQVADRLGYSRTTVAGAETAHRQPGEAFWTSCDDLLAPAGQLRSAYAQLAAARRDRARRLALQAELERETKLAQWRAAHNLPASTNAAGPAAVVTGPDIVAWLPPPLDAAMGTHVAARMPGDADAAEARVAMQPPAPLLPSLTGATAGTTDDLAAVDMTTLASDAGTQRPRSSRSWPSPRRQATSCRPP
jgi:transcriptional regulator with XRE-family HTH domain